MRVRPFLPRCAAADHVQARVVLPCVECGGRSESLVHLGDCRTEEEREERVGEAFERPRCARCAGKEFGR